MGGSPENFSAISQLSLKTRPSSDIKAGSSDGLLPVIVELVEKLRLPFFATRTDIAGKMC
jgi:hypothetical protein